MSVPSQHLDSVCLKSAPGFCLSQVRTWILSVPSQHLDYVCPNSAPGFCLSQVITWILSVSDNPGDDLRQTESR
jgi:hypothetical protein